MQTSLDHLANDFNHQATNIKDLQEKISSNAREINLFQGLQDIVEYLEKEVECGGDSRLAKILKKEIKQDLRQEMEVREVNLFRETIPYMLCHEISKEDGRFSKALQTQIHKIVKEYQQLHRT